MSNVRIISQKTLQDFWERHHDSKGPLKEWFKTALAAEWQTVVDIRKVYPHADAVDTPTSGILTVFNICGNKYRLIVRVKYAGQLINIRCVVSHKEYDKGNWKE
jgi:mRNA interferase HigB